MPPRKKTKLSPAAASTISRSTVEDKASPLKNETLPTQSAPDPWTDDQHTTLFKGMLRWKPVGMHKHFRMVALSQYMRSHGHDPIQAPHTNIPGIWNKLHSLYNLTALNEREDLMGDEDGSPEHELWTPFELPDEDFEDRMHARRINPAASSSPPALAQLWSEGELSRRRTSTVDDSEDPRSSPASARGDSKPKRGGRGGRSTRKSKLKEQLSPEAESEATNREEEKGEGEDGEEEEEEEEASEVGTPSSVAKKGKQGSSTRGGARGARGRFKKRGGRK